MEVESKGCSWLMLAWICLVGISCSSVGEAASSLVERQQVVMGTYVTALFPRNDKSSAGQVFSIFRELDAKLSTYKENSEVSRLNQRGKMEVSEELKEVTGLALMLAKQTKGFFDPAFGSPGSWLDIDVQENIIYLKNKAQLNFGGIGKGFAVDKVRERLKVRRGVVAASGDIYCFHRCKVAVRNPFTLSDSLVEGRLKRMNLALTTSGGYFRPGHLKSAKTGRSSKEMASLTLIASEKNAVLDAWATALITMPLGQALEELQKKMSWNWIVVSNEGRIYRSSEFSQLADWEWSSEIKDWKITRAPARKKN